jgi:uncharacterized protein YaiI (UPF0178 family)
MRIIVDGDACPVPVKEMLYKASARLQVELLLVANRKLSVPSSPLIRCEVVEHGADVADDHIAEIVQPGELVITADIPLADRIIRKGGVVLDPRGDFLDSDNIGPRLALRDLMDGLRAEGVQTPGSGAYGIKEKAAFANNLDRFLTKALKRR